MQLGTGQMLSWKMKGSPGSVSRCCRRPGQVNGFRGPLQTPWVGAAGCPSGACHEAS